MLCVTANRSRQAAFATTIATANSSVACLYVFYCIHLFHRIRIRFSVLLLKTFPKREFVWVIGDLTAPSASLQACSLAHAASELAARYCIAAAVSNDGFETAVFDDVVVTFPDSL
jgi:hypothetical protein